MPDNLYLLDTLAWSEQQVALLRRLAAGERVNDLDWPHVIEQIEDVGKAELRACQSLLSRALEHLLKLCLWPEHATAAHWRREARSFLRDAAKAFSPSMRQFIDVTELYRVAREDVLAEPYDGQPSVEPAATCPITLEELLAGATRIQSLIERLILKDT